MTAAPIRVLVVEDEPLTASAHADYVRRVEGFEVAAVAGSGAEAIRALRADPAIALILLDMNMPVLNGLAFLEAYTQLPSTVQDAIIIVMLTTSLHPVDLARAQQLPIAGFLNKPLTEEKVADLLREHFAVATP